jgi:uncharacterized membrane protein
MPGGRKGCYRMGWFGMAAVLTVCTFVPGLEARASIPLALFHTGIRQCMGLPVALTICLLSNILVGVLTFWLMGPVVQMFRRWAWFERVVWPRFERTRQKLHPYVERYGEWGLAIFIGVPLPGTGAYTGAFGAFLLGMDRRRFLVANALGVLIACLAVSVLCLLIDHGFVAEQSLLRKLFLKSVNLNV